jgi:hypothetical protein
VSSVLVIERVRGPRRPKAKQATGGCNRLASSPQCSEAPFWCGRWLNHMVEDQDLCLLSYGAAWRGWLPR